MSRTVDRFRVALGVHWVVLVGVFAVTGHAARNAVPDSFDHALLTPMLVGGFLSSVATGLIARRVRGTDQIRRGRGWVAVLSVFVAVAFLAVPAVAYNPFVGALVAGVATALVWVSASRTRETGSRYVAVLAATVVAVGACYAVGAYMFTGLHRQAGVNGARARFKAEIAAVKKFTARGGRLHTFTFALSDPLARPTPVEGYPDRFAVGAYDPDGDLVVLFDGRRVKVNQITGAPSNDNRGTCSYLESHGPQYSPGHEDISQTCAPVPGYEAKVTVTTGVPAIGSYTLHVAYNVTPTRFLDISVTDPKHPPTDPVTFATSLLDSVVTYDPDRWTAHDMVDAARAADVSYKGGGTNR